VSIGEVQPDEVNSGRMRVVMQFALDSGRYATLILKSAAALIGDDILVR